MSICCRCRTEGGVSIFGLSKKRCGAVGLVLTASAIYAHAAEFDGAKRVFEREWREIDANYDAGRKAAVARYREDLQSVLSYMERRGDEFGVRPTKAEIERFDREKTVPVEPDVGAPELIKKAMARYQDVVTPMDVLRGEKRDALLDKYVAHLSKLEARLEQDARKGEARAVRAEIERATETCKGAESDGARSHTIVLPSMYARSLSLVYLTALTEGKRIPDQSGRRRHGQLIGTRPAGGESRALDFSQYQDVIEVEPIRVGSQWTLVVEAEFPLASQGKQRVLASAGFRQDHVIVDNGGVLGVGAGSFAGSEYNVSKLTGWHRLTVVAKGNETAFYVDGKLVGTASGVCKEPLAALGNSAASGYPWGGALRAVLLWTRSLSREEIAGLPGQLAPE